MNAFQDAGESEVAAAAAASALGGGGDAVEKRGRMCVSRAEGEVVVTERYFGVFPTARNVSEEEEPRDAR